MTFSLSYSLAPHSFTPEFRVSDWRNRIGAFAPVSARWVLRQNAHRAGRITQSSFVMRFARSEINVAQALSY